MLKCVCFITGRTLHIKLVCEYCTCDDWWCVEIRNVNYKNYCGLSLMPLIGCSLNEDEPVPGIDA